MPAPTLTDYRRLTEMRLPAPASAPRVTVVTVTFNAAATVERTIRSVHAQSWTDLEHVVVDGLSTDGTVELVRRLLRPQDVLISEADAGISDAINKGIALARGDYIQLLHADDWMSPDQLAVAVATLDRTGADFAFGDLIFYEGERASFTYRGDPDYARTIHHRLPALNHPTVLARRSAYARIGLFDPAYRCAMDYDWFLRLHRSGGTGVYDPAIVAHMTHDGVSNTQFRRTIDEVRRIAIADGRQPFLANGEALYRVAKTAASRRVKRHAEPLYHLIRRAINRSYDPTIEDRSRASNPDSGRAA